MQQALCRRCGEPYASAMMISDLTKVESLLGFRYEIAAGKGGAGEAAHYQQICPKCRRALFGSNPLMPQ